MGKAKIQFNRSVILVNFNCQDEEPDTSSLDVDYNFYEDFVWPAISNRVPAFENSKVSV